MCVQPLFCNLPPKCTTVTYASLQYKLAVRISVAHSGPLWLTLALSGSLWLAVRLSLAHSGSLWLPLALSASLWLSEFAYKALAWLTRPLLGS